MKLLLLDTCAAIWAAEGLVLSDEAMEALNEAHHKGARVYVSPITAWEIGLLMARGRLTSLLEPKVWFSRLIDLQGVGLAEMTPDLLIASSYLPAEAPRDPADRIIVATARAYNYTLVTRDRVLLDYAEAGHLQAIAC
jgi:PIN domain nuclease of toxin-antitoxin system